VVSDATPASFAVAEAAWRNSARWRRRGRRALHFALHNPLAVLAALVLCGFVVVVIFAGQIAPFDPLRVSPLTKLRGPSSQHLLGTDSIGRDVLSRLIYGGRTSLRVAFTVVVLSTVIGTLIGLVSGYLGGLPDMLIQRVIDTIQAFPALILALFLISLFGRGSAGWEHPWRDVSLPITIVFIPGLVRVVRASVLAVKNADYITSAKTVGANSARVMFRHILPNVLAPILVVLSLNFGFAILIEATLGFLGYGTQEPNPSWGGMLAGDGRKFLDPHPYLVIAPAAVISLTVLAVNILGDTLRDALDPELRGRG
jgi:ABC-type dipeptide/oligopeptide/nickel transport system permease subunit